MLEWIIIIAIIFCCVQQHKKYQQNLLQTRGAIIAKNRAIIDKSTGQSRGLRVEIPICRYVNATGPLEEISGSSENAIYVYTTDKFRRSPIRYLFGEIRERSSIMILNTGTEYDNQIFQIISSPSNGVWQVNVAPFNGQNDYKNLKGTYYILDA
jgi:hypothetical protein